jgi:hypothetical protein
MFRRCEISLGKGPVVAHIGPYPAGASLALGQHWYRGVSASMRSAAKTWARTASTSGIRVAAAAPICPSEMRWIQWITGRNRWAVNGSKFYPTWSVARREHGMPRMDKKYSDIFLEAKKNRKEFRSSLSAFSARRRPYGGSDPGLRRRRRRAGIVAEAFWRHVA